MIIILVTGGNVSGLGKGACAAAIGNLFRFKLNIERIQVLKFDGYLNQDAGTMRNCEHGEVFVTECGKETDLDLGHYERFLDINFSLRNSITMGQVYKELGDEEREGKYLGKTVQVIPHVVDKINEKILAFEEIADVLIIEVGGTVGDIESLPILKALSILEGCKMIHIHLAKLDCEIGTIKTRLIQSSIEELGKLGLIPDITVCRSYKMLTNEEKEYVKTKLKRKSKYTVFGETLDYLYDIPKYYESQNMLKVLSLLSGIPYNGDKINFVPSKISCDKKIDICIGSKYNGADSYLSIEEALKHVMYHLNVKINVDFIDLNENYMNYNFDKYDGIIIPGGFGSKAIENKISLIKYARENKVPCLGLCLGMQLMIIEFARNKCDMKNANSEEFNDMLNGINIIKLMDDQQYKKQVGGTMRLGAYECMLTLDSMAYSAYGTPYVKERHRHRYEVNNEYLDMLEDNGIKISGINMQLDLVEIIELPEEIHPFFLGTQFHPEYKSRPNKPHPLFREFIKAIIKKQSEME